jgi:hypothetical protein
MTIRRPEDGEFAAFYAAYIGRVTEPDVLPVLEAQPAELRALAAGIRRDHELFRYEPGKWSVRQTFGHLIDTERVMGYRAFSIGRGEVKPLPGFDQNDYVARAHAEERTVADLADEFASTRAANLWPIKEWTEADAARIGNANGHPVSARAIAYIMAGHVRHHIAILRDLYKLDG